jgi:hypothetical protein
MFFTCPQAGKLCSEAEPGECRKCDRARSSILEAQNSGLEEGVVGRVEPSYELASEVPAGDDGRSIVTA